MKNLTDIARELLTGAACLGFYVHTKSWYYSHERGLEGNKVESIMLGVYHPAGGTSGEFEVTWEKLSGSIVARLKMFDDSWILMPLLSHPGGLFEYLAHLGKNDDRKSVAPEKFADRLVEMGFRDITAYHQRADGRFDQVQNCGPIPNALRSYFPGYNYFASRANVSPEWLSGLVGRYEYNDDLLLMEDEQDGVLARMSLDG